MSWRGDYLSSIQLNAIQSKASPVLERILCTVKLAMLKKGPLIHGSRSETLVIPVLGRMGKTKKKSEHSVASLREFAI